MTSPSAKSQRDWNVLEGILDEALEAPIEEREGIIAARCGSDAELRAAVEGLLQACEEQRGFLDTPAAAFAAQLAAEESARDQGPAAGTVIGSYRLIREIARGGMGSVHLAERADGQFEQRVALKLIKRGMDSDEVSRRFFAERRILARLSHPNIARLLDGGMTSEGQPWFAMEFVDGKSITKYSESHDLTVPQRIALFEDVCSAVQYAHQNLVIHRDLKPSNILVTEDGQVKLLDFGIAKLLEVESEEFPATLTDVRVMTPEYASPEQVRGDPVTTATDVYALGAVLYELLSGRRAHQFKRKSAAEIEHVVTEVDPESPGISGDLDTIILKSLQKDPSRRYQSVEALNDDLERFTAGLPVSARPDTIRYRTRKFIRRYRLLVAATIVIMLALAAGLAGTLWQARNASRQAAIASAEAAKATQVKDFLVGIFRGSDPNMARAQNISARDLLESGRRNLDTALTQQPEVQAELLDVLGTIHGELGLFDQADTLMMRSIAVARALHGATDSTYLERLAHRAAMLSMWSHYGQADTLLENVIDTRRRTLRPDDPSLAAALSQRGEIQRLKGNLDLADTLLREAVSIHRRRAERNDLLLAADLHNLAQALEEKGSLPAADSALDEAIAIRRARLDEDHPLLLTSLNLQALLKLDHGSFAEAEKIAQRVVAARRRIYGDDHLQVANALNTLGLATENLGHLDSAGALYTRGLEINRKALGDDANATTVLANNLAVYRYRIRDLKGAVQAMRLARDAWTRTLGVDHQYTITATSNLGAMLSDLGSYDEAERLIRDALQRRTRQFGDTSATVAQSLRNLGILLHRTNRRGESEKTLRKSLAIYLKSVGPEHTRVAEAETALGLLLNDLGKSEEAERILRNALAIRAKAMDEKDTRVAETKGALGEALLLRGKYVEAEKLLRESYASYAANGRDAPAIERARKRLARLSSLHAT